MYRVVRTVCAAPKQSDSAPEQSESTFAPEHTVAIYAFHVRQDFPYIQACLSIYSVATGVYNVIRTLYDTVINNPTLKLKGC